MRKLFRFVVVIISVLVVGGCNNTTTTRETLHEKNEIKIGVLIYRFDDEFIQSVMDEIRKEYESLNNLSETDLIIEFIDGNNQADLQYDQIEQMINDGFNVLAINLVDRSEASRVIDMAKAKDIPIVFFNREPVQVDMVRWNKLYYVGSKGEDAGKLQGEIVAETWKNNPGLDKNHDGIMQYIMIEGQPGHQDAILRTAHSIKAIKDQGIIVEELITDTANWQRQESKEKMYSYLNVFKDDVEFIISNNDMMALGAIDAMKELGFDQEQLIPIVGVDAVDLAIDALEKGEMTGTVFNDCVNQGQMVMRIAYYLGIGEDPKDYIEEIDNGKYYRVEYIKVTK